LLPCNRSSPAVRHAPKSHARIAIIDRAKLKSIDLRSLFVSSIACSIFSAGIAVSIAFPQTKEIDLLTKSCRMKIYKEISPDRTNFRVPLIQFEQPQPNRSIAACWSCRSRLAGVVVRSAVGVTGAARGSIRSNLSPRLAIGKAWLGMPNKVVARIDPEQARNVNLVFAIVLDR
jgi:hypothetical protein